MDFGFGAGRDGKEINAGSHQQQNQEHGYCMCNACAVHTCWKAIGCRKRRLVVLSTYSRGRIKMCRAFFLHLLRIFSGETFFRRRLVSH